MEPGECLCIENGIGESIQNRDRLTAREAVPIEQIERDLVRIAIGDSQIDREPGAGILRVRGSDPRRDMDQDPASRFEVRTKPPNVTTWEDSPVDIVFRAREKPSAFTSSNGKIAYADHVPAGVYPKLKGPQWLVDGR